MGASRYREHVTRLAPVLLTLLLACGDDDAPADTGVADTSDDAPDEGVSLPPPPAMPERPALPDLTPCLDGWREATVGDDPPLTVCDGVPRQACASDEYLFVTGCRPVGDACPVGAFADEPVGATSVLYVDPAAAPGGDGSEGLPFTTVAEALATATAGATILLARGDHLGGFALGQSVSLRGACPAATTITAPADGSAGNTITVRSDDVQIENLKITGAANGIRVESGVLALAGVVVDRAAGVGIIATGGSVDANDLAIVDTQPVAEDLGLGLIALGAESSVNVARLSLARNHSFSSGANAGGRLTMSDARITDSMAVTADDLGFAISAVGGGYVRCDGCLIEHSEGVAVQVNNPGTVVELSDCRIDETVASGPDDAAVSVLAAGQSQISLTRTAITRSDIAALAFGDGATGLMTDVIVHEANQDAGLAAFARTTLEGTRLVISDVVGVGLQITNPASTAQLTDLTIANTRVRELDGIGGRSLEVSDGASVTLERALLTGSQEVALLMDRAASVSARDLTIEETVATLGIGRGVNLQGGATLDVTRFVVSQSVEVGVFLHGDGTAVSLSDARIMQTAARDCLGGECPSGAGIGLVVLDGADATVDRFEVADNALAGLQAFRALVRWSNGVVRGHPIGVNLQMTEFDPADLSDNVVYLDNDQNLDASELPIPAPTVSASP